MIRSTGTRGSMSSGSLPSLCRHERMAARSTSSGTPVKSCSNTRETTNGISSVLGAFGFHEANEYIAFSGIIVSSKFLIRDSRIILKQTGNLDRSLDMARSNAGKEIKDPWLPVPNENVRTNSFFGVIV